MPRSRLVIVVLLTGVLVPACAHVPFSSPRGDDGLRVQEAGERVVVAAWAEPRSLPKGGGQCQILVRVQKEGGARFPGVEVRLRVSNGTLYSTGRTLVTDAQGMTRDRLTARESATVTLNAGGTLYRFQVPVGEQPGGQEP
jgi:hypothetical protein